METDAHPGGGIKPSYPGRNRVHRFALGSPVGGGAVSVWGVQMVGSTLYASDMLNGLWKIDVSSLKR